MIIAHSDLESICPLAIPPGGFLFSDRGEFMRNLQNFLVIAGWSASGFVALVVELAGVSSLSCAARCGAVVRKGDWLVAVRCGDRLNYFHLACLPGRFLRGSGRVRGLILSRLSLSSSVSHRSLLNGPRLHRRRLAFVHMRS